MKVIIKVLIVSLFSFYAQAEDYSPRVRDLIADLEVQFQNRVSFDCQTWRFSEASCIEGLEKIKSLNLEISDLEFPPSKILVSTFSKPLAINWADYSSDIPSLQIWVSNSIEMEKMREIILLNSSSSKKQELISVLDLSKRIADTWNLHDRGYGCRNLEEGEACEEPTPVTCVNGTELSDCLRLMNGLDGVEPVNFGQVYVSRFSVNNSRRNQVEGSQFLASTTQTVISVETALRDGWAENLRTEFVRVRDEAVALRPKP